MGHESLGEVVEVGSEVSGIKPGDLVVTTVRRSCGQPECRPCQHNRPDFCLTGAYTERGIKGRHGFMTDEVIDEAKNMHVVPREIADIAVLTEPLTIAEKALNELDSILVRMPWINPGEGREAGPQRAWSWARGRSGSWPRWRCWCAASTPGSTRCESATSPRAALGRELRRRSTSRRSRCRSATSASAWATST